MDSVILQLKREFHAKIHALQTYALPQSKPTLTLLTDEELQELEQVWVELAVWKKTQSH